MMSIELLHHADPTLVGRQALGMMQVRGPWSQGPFGLREGYQGTRLPLYQCNVGEGDRRLYSQNSMLVNEEKNKSLTGRSPN